ncbi:MAG: DNA polymerase III subunit delta' [Rubrivivax sp.]|nr:DNA polymerase III subunit delta' [Rubrivivax sp.]
MLPLPWLAAPMRQALSQPGHALLVLGAPGVGAFEFQHSLAQTWLCEAAAPGAAACGRCVSCHLVQAHSHPDLMLLLPEAQRAERGWLAAPDADAEGAGKRKPSRQIRIGEVRAAVDWIVKTSSRGHAKVLLLHPAEAMNLHAASALLKTLEEPPAGARMLLSCSDAERLLPTVRSRCQRLTLPPPTEADAVAWLAGQGVRDPAVLLAACAGRPLDVLAWHARGVDAAAWAALPRAVAAGHAAALAGWPLPQVIDALQKLCHDLMAVSAGAPARYFPAAGLPPARDASALMDWAAELNRVARHADHPWQEALLLESMVSQGQRALDTLAP